MMNFLKENKTIILFLFILIIFAYSPVFQAEFLNWDDVYLIELNPLLKDFSIQNVGVIFSRIFEANYQPLTTLSYAIEQRLFGHGALPHHLINLILHFFNSILVMLFIGGLFHSKGLSLLCGFVFALHPVHVESVAWISGRKDVLFSFFYLLSLLSYLRFKRSNQKSFFYLCFIFFFLSLFSKAMAVTLPLILILIDSAVDRKEECDVKEKIPFFVLSLLFVAIGFLAQDVDGAVSYSFLKNPINHALLIPFTAGSFLFNSIFPFSLSAHYPYPVNWDEMILPVCFLGVVIYLILKTVRNNELVRFGTLFFFFTIFPVLNIIPLGNAALADRYLYLPLLGITVLVYEWVRLWAPQRGFFKMEGVLTIACLTLLYAGLTNTQARIWKNSETLWTDVIKNQPLSGFAYYQRGSYYDSKGNRDAAVSDFDKALEVDANYRKRIYAGHISLGTNLLDFYFDRANKRFKEKQYKGAFDDVMVVLGIDPRNSEAFYLRGRLYEVAGKSERAELDFKQASKLKG